MSAADQAQKGNLKPEIKIAATKDGKLPNQSTEEGAEKTDELDTFEINELEIPDRDSEDIDLEHCRIENLDCLVNLTVLDLSFNRIKRVENLDKLTKLKKLFFVNNRLSKIENLDALVELEMLELGSNKIRKIENIAHLVNLAQLYLGKNKIPAIENLDALTNLTLLSIQVSILVHFISVLCIFTFLGFMNLVCHRYRFPRMQYFLFGQNPSSGHSLP
ncbi:Protein phosphatase 1 regulatory subunit 7 [Fasciolopsis buskii]|uniref:Protein phosphatase 1 regulatory subunit 7 n=1 Tax=Fasciolopsis buskii TaxID=27845 RepID=A0A8E0RP01_9TREM|nr:Protein phosphatase 1 regulatory subunit 7 [Fasciolopsis buski]